MKRIMYTGLLISYIVSLFVDSKIAVYVTGLFVLGSIAASIRGARKLYKAIGAMFMIVSLIMFPFANIQLAELPLHITSTVSVVALLYMLPFINNVFRIGRYDMKIRKLLTLRMRHFGQLYTKSMFASYLMSIFLFFAALPLIYDVIQKQVAKLPEQARKMFVSQALLRGFTAAEVWSPMEVLVVVVLDLIGVNYLSALPLLLLLSIIYFFGAAWRGKKYARYLFDGSDRVYRPAIDAPIADGYSALPAYKADGNVELAATVQCESEYKEAEAATGQSAMDPIVTKSIIAMLAAMVGLITIIAFVHHVAGIGFLAAVTVCVLPYALIWAALLGRFRPYVRYSRLIWGARIDGIQNMALLFLTLGIFNSMAEASGLLDVIQQPFINLSGMPLLLFFAVQLCTLLFSLIGFHPLVSVSLFGLVMQPLIGDIAPLSIVIVLITSGLSTASSGAFNTSVNITADILEVNPYQITWWNLRYALFIGTVGTLLAYLLHVIM